MRIQAWRSDVLLAIQIPGAVEDLPQDVRPIVENQNPDYRRVHLADKNLAIAAINAGDVVKPEDLDDPSATCWIKMSEVSIEGLRQAFLDPGSRIRLNSQEDESEPEEHAELATLAWKVGFLDGVAVRLNANLNITIRSMSFQPVAPSSQSRSCSRLLLRKTKGHPAARAATGFVLGLLLLHGSPPPGQAQSAEPVELFRPAAARSDLRALPGTVPSDDEPGNQHWGAPPPVLRPASTGARLRPCCDLPASRPSPPVYPWRRPVEVTSGTEILGGTTAGNQPVHGRRGGWT